MSGTHTPIRLGQYVSGSGAKPEDFVTTTESAMLEKRPAITEYSLYGVKWGYYSGYQVLRTRSTVAPPRKLALCGVGRNGSPTCDG